MNFRFTTMQFNCLYNIFKTIVLEDKSATTMEEKLVHTIMLRIYKKLYRKAIEHKPRYSVMLDQEEMMAFYIYFKDTRFNNVSLEAVVIGAISGKADKQFA